MHKYKLRSQKFVFAKANSSKLAAVLVKAACTSLTQLLYASQFFDVSSIRSSHNNLTKPIQFSQSSGEITNPTISKKIIMLMYSEFST